MLTLPAFHVHLCRVAEDVAIAYGFNNIVKKIPTTPTVGKQLPINAVYVR